MHLVYIDDSKDANVACFSAIIVSVDLWQECLNHLVEIRRTLAKCNGIYLRKEVHATDWVSGKGHIAKRPVSIAERVSLYNYILASIAMMPSAQVINGAVPRLEEDRLFERLLNRINVNMTKSGSYCLIISDEGKSYDSMLRRMRHFNYIPSMLGAWRDGASAKNIKIDRIVEDINYRDSRHSLFIQAADCCAYALLRRESQVPSKTALGLHESLYILDRVMVKAAYGKDPLGIIR